MATKRSKGSKWEYVVKRAKLLPKPLYFVFDNEAEGDAYVAALEALLDKGVVPTELLPSAETIALLAELIQEYLTNNAVASSDVKVLNVIYARIGRTPIKSINYAWVEKWIMDMKQQLNLAPGTIRHHVGALGRCFDYAGRRNLVSLVINPIRQLPKRYAQYTAKDEAMTTAFNSEHTSREDIERDRRLGADEEERIRKVMNRVIVAKRERPLEMRFQAATELLYDLALETAMRMREMYSLTLDQVDLPRRTIFLDRTKNGNKRQVPLSSVAVLKIQEYMRHVEDGSRNMAGFDFRAGRLFPWWDGALDEESLIRLTSKLSAHFRTITVAADVRDFRFHDLRHEATSRLFERTSLSEFEIMKITGHSSTRMLRRYANLRGSDLAGKLW